MHQERKLATIRKISSIEKIENAEKICLYKIDGWQVVDLIDKYTVGQMVCFIEIDSWVPNTLAPFLTKSGHYPKVYQGIEGQRLRTMKLRGALSQGLVLSIGHCISVMGCSTAIEECADVTEWLGIVKWEKELHPSLAGTARGNFPTEVPKTSETRVQNIRDLEKFDKVEFEVTEKLHGSSCTFYLDKESNFHVCSRNLDLIETEDNLFWKAARKYDVENFMRSNQLQGFAIQGELIGEGINGNQYKTDLEFYMFKLYIVGQGYATPMQRKTFMELFKPKFKHVPFVADPFVFDASLHTSEFLLQYCKGKSLLNGSVREGLVFKSPREEGFKVINNDWLINNPED